MTDSVLRAVVGSGGRGVMANGPEEVLSLVTCCVPQ